MTKSKIKINPVTMEIEIEVSDSFLEKYFKKLTNRFPKSNQLTPKIKSIKTAPKPVSTVKKGAKKTTTKPGGKNKKYSIQEAIMRVIMKDKDEGASINDIVKSTKLEKIQIYNSIKTLKSKGIIQTTGRGKYRKENGEE